MLFLYHFAHLQHTPELQPPLFPSTAYDADDKLIAIFDDIDVDAR